jgi:hypothetical protein
MTIINAATFEIAEIDAHGIERGTVEVTLGATTRRVRASRFENCLTAGEMHGRYRSSAKLWPATVWQQVIDGEICEFGNFGRDDRSGRFNKLNCIFFV